MILNRILKYTFLFFKFLIPNSKFINMRDKNGYNNVKKFKN